MTIVNGAAISDEVRTDKRHNDNVSKLPAAPKPTPWFRTKGVFDRTLAGMLLVPCLPLMLFLVIVIRLTSKGPGFFRQKRVGKNGVIFTMFKLRSMQVDAEHGSGAVWARDDDPRTTRIGRFLRRFHLDELPQLFNVLRGEMSLVGPRPERPEFVSVLSEIIPRYECRLLVPPGVTGLAQVNLPPDSDIDSVCRKLALDLEYIETGGLWLDFRLVACTAARLVKVIGLRWISLFGLSRDLSRHPRYVRLPEVAVTCHLSPAALAEALGKGKTKANGNGHGKLAETLSDLSLEDTQEVQIRQPR